MTGDRAASLRAAFDGAFAEPPAARVEGLRRLLSIDAGTVRVAVPIEAVAAVERLPRVTALPGAPRGLRGIAAVRGRMVPVYALADLLGERAQEVDDPWLLLHEAGGDVLGLSFSAFHGWLEVAPVDVLASVDPDPALPSLVRRDGVVRYVVHLPSLLERCRRAAGVTA